MTADDSPVGTSPLSPKKRYLVGPVTTPELHVMSWNIRRKMTRYTPRSSDRWDRRAPRVQALLRAECPTLLGVQEALPDQARFIGESLGVNYRWVGRGRGAGGRGEGCPIFYDAERLEMIEWNQVALSDRPSRQGSKSWGNILPRILVSATFRDRTTSHRFEAINTHLDHLSAKSRVRSARAIRESVSMSEMPTVLTGDLNSGGSSEPMQALLAAGLLTETWDMAQSRESEEWNTYSNYRAPRIGRDRRDWILATPDFRVDRAAINPQRFAGGWASDHLPVHAVLRLSERDGSE